MFGQISSRVATLAAPACIAKRVASNRNAPSNARDHGHRAAAGRALMLSAA
jgi:hypothetical protein